MSDPRFFEAWSPAEGAARADQGFRARFGSAPAGVWAAPGRVNLIGEHTDYNGGLSLPIALPHRTYFAASPSGSDNARLTSAQAADAVFEIPMARVAPGAVKGWGAYAVGVLWALRLRDLPAPALTGHVDSCVPLGAGLSSSAALEAAVALAATDLGGGSGAGSVVDGVVSSAGFGGLPDAVGAVDGIGGVGVFAARSLGGAGGPAGGERARRAILAAACVDAENRIAGAPTGGMDQAAALLAAEGHALLVDSTSGASELVPFDLAAAGLELLVIDTRAKHALVDGQYGERRATCERAAAVLGVENLGQLPVAELPEAIARLGGADAVAARRVRHVVTEIDRTRQFVGALRAGELALTGPLMDGSHASLRDDYEVSAPELDLAVAAARQAGALGARMTGGGFGGSAIALVRRSESATVAAAVAASFARAGWKTPVFLLADPAGPAERLL
ncbi:MAG: galactokinase [Bifidobacteriaceae bacterium]|jgi:galactokinase|nr:galactokinase [Bifidobacteriaceae bacterium]